MNESYRNTNSEDTQDYDWAIAEQPPETILDRPLHEVAVEPMGIVQRARSLGKAVFEVVWLGFDGEAH